MTNLYHRQNMMDHAKNPRCFGKIENYDYKAHVVNRHCGDEIDVYLSLDGNVVKDIMFNGEACAVSKASASMVLEDLSGSNLEELNNIDEEAVLNNFGENLTTSRRKCALLIYDALQDIKLNIDGKS